MKVSDILRIKGDTVQTVLSWNTIAEAATRLAGPPAIGALVVSDDGRRERVDGIVSERDIVRRLADAMGLMNRWRHRHLPVVDGGRLVGMISIGDVVKQRLAEMGTEAGVLRDIYLASH
ncbi:CBS domain-containing protein [Pseudonocardia sp. ICBG1142]|uniref:CBS domain-containing protein n=1 Tax=Pseudonocardia sp. ICBG1142 TaxID=2846760 RepID=UPI001CF679EA|nr:CBS domain-containing protein [Pseudonocardia sp. ICBG1142]